ncbi:uncharacterized protein LOC110810941 [Carica papaya]|uniref:uncharacterized protein LOC110810941 n=1 Tax=Carica papaya TaxID=3649 RepID=UPI000B8CEEC6|nr:uncharacterized protein LOC110810941 [Carica papaya]
MDESKGRSLVQEREEFMVTVFGDGNPVQRTARFLQPTGTSMDGLVAQVPSLSPSSLFPAFQSSKLRYFSASFLSWQVPTETWQLWVDILHPKYESVWKRAGIHEAIMSSRYSIWRDTRLVSGLAKKWCYETNTFVFSWGEATLTLEDVMILGGFSVLGLPVSFSGPLTEIEVKLRKARSQLCKPSKWIKKFMQSGSEIEHEAFLSLWLARFVFPESKQTVETSVFPISARLARGERMALAPAVLANIYRDLSLYTGTLVDSTSIESSRDGEEDHFQGLKPWSPLQLVQLWAWERFQELQPKPNEIRDGDPRAARWDKVRCLKRRKVQMDLDFAGDSFHWRPYASLVDNWLFPKFYNENQAWVCVESGMEEELLSFAYCSRVCELVGPRCIKQYLPHRVAMQFGIDQDLPFHVARCADTHEIAWKNYTRPFGVQKLYIPSRFFEAGVTVRYKGWWKQSVMSQLDVMKGVVVRKKRSTLVPWVLKENEEDNNGGVPLSFPPKSDNHGDVPPGFPPKADKKDDFPPGFPLKSGNNDDLPPGFLCVSKENNTDNNGDVPPGFTPRSDNNGDFSPGFPPKSKMVKDVYLASATRQCEDTSNTSQASQIPDDGEGRKMLWLIEAVEKTVEAKGNKEEAARSMENAEGNRDEDPLCTTEKLEDRNGEDNIDGTDLNLIFELEARVARLERMLPEIKDARMKNRYEKKCEFS